MNAASLTLRRLSDRDRQGVAAMKAIAAGTSA